MDCAGPNSLIYGRIIPSRVINLTQKGDLEPASDDSATDEEEEDVVDVEDMTQVKKSLPKKKFTVAPIMVECIIGPEAWKRFQVWLAPSELSVEFIPPLWIYQRPNYKQYDFLMQMFVKAHCLLAVNENRIREINNQNLRLKMPALGSVRRGLPAPE